MRGAERLGGDGEAEFGGSGGDAAIEGAGSFRNFLNFPVQNLAHGVDGGGEEREVGALAHIEAARAGVVFVGVENEAGKVAGIGALNPAFLERRAGVPLGSDVEKADRVGAEKPLVTGGGGEVGLDVMHVERERAEGLSEIEDERGAEMAAGLADADEIETAAAGPVNMRERGDGDFGRERGERGGGPVVVGGPGHDFERRAAFTGEALPREVVGGKLLVEDEDALALAHGDVASGGLDSVAGGGDDGDAIGGATEEGRGDGAEFLGAGEKLFGNEIFGRGRRSPRRAKT